MVVGRHDDGVVRILRLCPDMGGKGIHHGRSSLDSQRAVDEIILYIHEQQKRPGTVRSAGGCQSVACHFSVD
jgi:hypothetical protein